MRKIAMTLILFALAFINGQAQTLPANTCGVVFSYDAAGNRTQRMYVCNNGARVAAAENKTEELPQVDALYPNPTTGIFRVTFTKPLDNARITLVDMNGKVMQQRTASGTLVNFDVSRFPAGVYWVQIRDGKNSFTYKVIRE